jgi:hypothetical protein
MLGLESVEGPDRHSLQLIAALVRVSSSSWPIIKTSSPPRQNPSVACQSGISQLALVAQHCCASSLRLDAPKKKSSIRGFLPAHRAKAGAIRNGAPKAPGASGATRVLIV